MQQVTGRSVGSMPENGFDTALFLTGRRSGKSKIASVIAAYEAVLSGKHKQVDPGDTPVVACLSTTRKQSGVVKDNIQALFSMSPILKGQIVGETKDTLRLRNGVEILILAGDWRTCRGFNLIAVVVDEAAMFGVEATSCKSDTELIRALQPGLATTGGKLIAISSPYAREGWCYQTYDQCFGNPDSSTLVVNGPSRTFNPMLPESVVERAMASDPAAARAEYLGQFRDSIQALCPLEVARNCVRKSRTILPPRANTQYTAFCDFASGTAVGGDDAALAIAHRLPRERKVVIDFLRRFKPPFNPHSVLRQMASDLADYGVRSVYADHFASGFVNRGFDAYGIRMESTKSKSELYLDFLPLLTAREVELLDHPDLIQQLCSLERKTRSGGRDSVDHPPQAGYHDDLINCVAGAAVHAFRPVRMKIGALV